MYDLSFLDNDAILQLPAERVLFYSLIRGLKPKRYLEIVSGMGGSALIAHHAMSQYSFPRIACVDDRPEQISTALLQKFGASLQMFVGKSPDILHTQVALDVKYNDPFDFVFIDADHRFEHVSKDITAVIPLLASEATIVFHDAHYPGVKLAVDLFVKKYKRQTRDAGILTADFTEEETATGSVKWGGMRLVRWTT